MTAVSRSHHAPFLRFDNLTGDPDGFAPLLFRDPIRTIRATRRQDVPAALHAVDRAVLEGYCAAGYLAYEAGDALDERLRTLPQVPSHGAPLVWFGIFEGPTPVPDPPLALGLPRLNRRPSASVRIPAPAYSRYAADIRTIRRYIAAGDVYQINHTFRLELPLQDDPLIVYHRLLRVQPTGFCAFLWDGDRVVCSLSPELFFRRRGPHIVTRPMKGTAPRHPDPRADREHRERLAADPKNRAENLMIVDLLRNDLGKVCRIGSVRTPRLCSVETYPTVHQMTSTVEGRLRAETTYTDIFTALFPSGSVTGAPKLRAMEIIRELENTPRGIYTGAIGYILPDRTAVFNVAIRTLEIRTGGARLGTGSGIVWDSRPQAEYRESLLKTAFVHSLRESLRLIETMLLDHGRCPLEHLHRERLAHSARTLGFRWNPTRFVRTVRRQAQRHPRGRWRLRLVLDATGSFEMTCTPLDDSGSPGTPRIGIASVRVRSTDALLRHKTTDRHLYDVELGRARARGLLDVVFLNERGELTEGCIHNIFIQRNGRLHTPPASCGLLDGVMRRHLLRTRPNTVERTLTLDDLRNADAVYLTNAVRGIIPVRVVLPEDRIR